ncbi:MAG: phospho-sugar mutase [Spirochaetes bacterium]|nr:phospho-sugar mutase [Spirochaetota bacterium]
MGSDDLKKRIQLYLKGEEYPSFRKEVEELLEKEDWKELQDRFYRDLEFGTGGMRGIIGGGTNRMNPFTVRRATQGLANYLRKQKPTGVAVIAYDSRHFSDVFAKEAARVLASNGIRTYLFTTLRPTPMLSFAVRLLRADTGIVVTASHNPPEYNGYKVYWADGAQIVPPHDKGIIQEVSKVSHSILCRPMEELEANGSICFIDREVDEAYFRMVETTILRPELFLSHASSIQVVYTPLHGTGALPVETVLKRLGVTVQTVPAQRRPDGDFPTVRYPNPEEAEALHLALELGSQFQADLVMGTDPDADRLGVAVQDKGRFVLLTGNQLGCLLEDYILSTRKELGTLPRKAVIIKTIVTTELQRKIAEHYGASCVDVLTGFKYIGEMIRRFEEEKSENEYVFGGEESYGYLVNTDVRDKDAVSAAVMTVEMCLYYRSKGKTLYQRLQELFFQFGHYRETLISKEFKGEEGMHQMEALMNRLRTSPPDRIGFSKVVRVKDYLSGIEKNGEGKETGAITLPRSNVLQFFLEDESILSARPSGTEPKIKFYISCCTSPGRNENEAAQELDTKITSIKEFVDQLFE